MSNWGRDCKEDGHCFDDVARCIYCSEYKEDRPLYDFSARDAREISDYARYVDREEAMINIKLDAEQGKYFTELPRPLSPNDEAYFREKGFKYAPIGNGFSGYRIDWGHIEPK